MVKTQLAVTRLVRGDGKGPNRELARRPGNCPPRGCSTKGWVESEGV